jgi:hypothetical protein
MAGINGTILIDLKPAPGNAAKIIELNPPSANNAGDRFLANVSSIAQTARGYIQGTSIDIANAQIFHVCDPKGVVAVTLANINKTIAETIAKTINSLVASVIADSTLGPIYKAAKDLVKKALSYLKTINKTLQYINKAIIETNNLILYAKGFIDLIATLPAKLAQTLGQCLSVLRNALKTALTVNLGDIGGVIQQTQLAIQQTQTAISGVSTTAQNLNTVAKSLSDLPSTLSSNLSGASDTLASSLKGFTGSTTNLLSFTANSSNYDAPFVGRNGV